MTYEQEFLKEFEAWVDSQIAINEMAMEASRKLWKKIRMNAQLMLTSVMKVS